jgi:hypothetical protein
VLKRTWADEVRNVSLLVAISVNDQGYRQILGIAGPPQTALRKGRVASDDDGPTA